LATRKLCQNDEILALPTMPGAVDKLLAQPYLSAIVSMAIALVLLTFLAVEPRIAYFPAHSANDPRRGILPQRVTVS
jgi:hypothetical protein